VPKHIFHLDSDVVSAPQESIEYLSRLAEAFLSLRLGNFFFTNEGLLWVDICLPLNDELIDGK
jgi:hypothetical protein